MNKQEFEELQKNFASETKKRKYVKAFNYLTTFISVLGISVLTYYFANSIFMKSDLEKLIFQKEKSALTNRIKELESQMSVSDTSQIPKIQNEERIISLEKKIQALNNIIIENPEKALTIPLMNKDIENIRKDNDLQIELIRDKVETVIDLNKWILGLIFSLLITIVLSNFFKNESKSNTEK